MEEIFIYAFNDNDPIIVLATEATKYINPINQGTYLRLKNGTRYQGLPGLKNKKILDFDLYDLEIVSGDLKNALNTSSTIESTKTSDLLDIGTSFSSAELQWRFSQPISVLILSFLGIFLGETSPRGRKSLGLVYGLIIFIFYNNLLMLVKSSIENETINPFFGFLGLHVFVILLFLLWLRRQSGKGKHVKEEREIETERERKKTRHFRPQPVRIQSAAQNMGDICPQSVRILAGF